LEDISRGPAECRGGGFTGRASDLMLARREAAGERRGVI